jgi:hypothetical protein
MKTNTIKAMILSIHLLILSFSGTVAQNASSLLPILQGLQSEGLTTFASVAEQLAKYAFNFWYQL